MTLLKFNNNYKFIYTINIALLKYINYTHYISKVILMEKAQLKGEKNNNLTREDILKDFETLIKYLRLAKQNIKKNPTKIIKELEKWKEEITLQEKEDGINLILNKVNKWFNLYKNTNDVLQISLKEYDIVSKESSYILGACALIQDLYFVIIDFEIGCIGGIMCEKIKQGGTVRW